MYTESSDGSGALTQNHVYVTVSTRNDKLRRHCIGMNNGHEGPEAGDVLCAAHVTCNYSSINQLTMCEPTYSSGQRECLARRRRQK